MFYACEYREPMRTNHGQIEHIGIGTQVVHGPGEKKVTIAENGRFAFQVTKGSRSNNGRKLKKG